MSVEPSASNWRSKLRDEMEARSVNYAYVDWGFGMAPKGRFLLIRNKERICAIRFTDFRRGKDGKPATAFNSGDESLSADYEWHFQDGGDVNFISGNALSGTGLASEEALVGIGRLAFQLGHPYAKCGPLVLGWHYPAAISMYEGNRPQNQGFEIAPTKWSKIEDVNVNDASLKWYRYDEARKGFFIPMNEL